MVLLQLLREYLGTIGHRQEQGAPVVALVVRLTNLIELLLCLQLGVFSLRDLGDFLGQFGLQVC